MKSLQLKTKWIRFWMQRAGLNPCGRFALLVATWSARGSYKKLGYLANFSPFGYVSPTAKISHDGLSTGKHIFIGEGVVIYQSSGGGNVVVGQHSRIHRQTIIETGAGGSLTIGADTHIQAHCHFSAYVGSIEIGSHVQIAPNCAFFPYNHGTDDAARLIKDQPVTSQGDIHIEDDAWIGTGSVLLENVTIGQGAVIGAGSVVTRTIPPMAIACGVPATVVKYRST